MSTICCILYQIAPMWTILILGQPRMLFIAKDHKNGKLNHLKESVRYMKMVVQELVPMQCRSGAMRECESQDSAHMGHNWTCATIGHNLDHGSDLHCTWISPTRFSIIQKSREWSSLALLVRYADLQQCKFGRDLELQKLDDGKTIEYLRLRMDPQTTVITHKMV